MRYILRNLMLLILMFSTFSMGAFSSSFKNRSKFLSPDEAFKVSALVNGDKIDTKIVIADKIHIYQKSVHYTIISPSVFILDVKKPTAHKLEDDMVYTKEINVAISIKDITSKVKGDYTLRISYQGCSDAGICYQPIDKEFKFKGLKLSTMEKISNLIKEGNTAKIADVLMNESSFFILFLFFIFGLLLSLTPCIFPMIPILSSIIVSQQSGDDKPNVAKAFFTSLVYVVSMAVTYTIVGLIAGLLGADIQTAMQNGWVLTIFSAMFVALAFSLFGYYEIGLPSSWQTKLNKASNDASDKGGIAGTAVMGLLSALIVGPCVAPPLGGAILFISHTGDALLGGTALFIMSMGMGMPLLLLGIGAGKFMPKPGGWMNAVSQVFGVMMLGLAIFMISRVIPQSLTMLLWSLLFIGSSIYMGVFNPSSSRVKAGKLIQVLAMVFLLYGASLFIGSISGSSSVIRPFEKFTQINTVVSTALETTTKSHKGYSIDKLTKEISQTDKFVVVDFGKASCTACTELEEITFPNSEVKEQLKRFKFIKIDLTKNSDEDKALLKKFELFGTPNIIFFDKGNKYMPEKSLTGFISPKDFVKHLKSIK